MTQTNWNVEDYYVEFPELPTYIGPIVGMPIEYKAHMVLKYIRGVILQEVKCCIKSNSELAGVILCLATVDYLAGYYGGRQTGMKEFINFMEKYFPQKYQPYNETIYTQLRCGLIHSLATINPWRGEGKAYKIHSNSEPHLEEDRNGEGYILINFSIPMFLEDIRRAIVMYGHDVIMKNDDYPELRKKFSKRFNKLGGRGALMERTDNQL